MVNNFLSSSKDGVILSVKLVPNSSFSKVVDYTEEYIRIKIASPPIDNRANKELTAFCSDLLGINKSRIKIISGENAYFNMDYTNCFSCFINMSCSFAFAKR